MVAGAACEPTTIGLWATSNVSGSAGASARRMIPLPPTAQGIAEKQLPLFSSGARSQHLFECRRWNYDPQPIRPNLLDERRRSMTEAPRLRSGFSGG